MRQRGGARVHARLAVVGVACIGRAVVGGRRHLDRTAVERRDAEVGHAPVFQIVGLQQQLGIRCELQVQRRRDRGAVQKLLRAVAVGALHRAGDTERGRAIAEYPADVDLAAPVGPRAVAQAQVGDVQAGLLGHAVDQAARRAAAVQHGGRSLDHLDPLDVRQVAEIQRVVADAVDELVGDRGEAADRHLVALSIPMREAHPRHILQRVLDRGRVLVAHDFGGHHVHGLRHVAQRHVHLGGGDRIGRVVALAQLPACAGLDLHFGQRFSGLGPDGGRGKNGSRQQGGGDRVTLGSHFVMNCNILTECELLSLQDMRSTA